MPFFLTCFGQLDVDAFEVDGSSAVCASLKQYRIRFSGSSFPPISFAMMSFFDKIQSLIFFLTSGGAGQPLQGSLEAKNAGGTPPSMLH